MYSNDKRIMIKQKVKKSFLFSSVHHAAGNAQLLHILHGWFVGLDEVQDERSAAPVHLRQPLASAQRIVANRLAGATKLAVVYVLRITIGLK